MKLWTKEEMERMRAWRPRSDEEELSISLPASLFKKSFQTGHGVCLDVTWTETPAGKMFHLRATGPLTLCHNKKKTKVKRVHKLQVE